MDADSANERLQAIRTLMERSAIYRRALSPIMLFLGALGIIASVAGAMAQIESAVPFGFYWMSVSAAARSTPRDFLLRAEFVFSAGYSSWVAVPSR